MVQQGFAEAAQSQFLVRYLNAFAKRLGYKNLGVVVKGDAAATSMMPAFITRKLFKRLAALGRHYAQSGQWDKSIAAQLARPYHLSAQAAKGNERLNRLGIGHIAWHKFWRNNHLSVEQGRGRPYSS